VISDWQLANPEELPEHSAEKRSSSCQLEQRLHAGNLPNAGQSQAPPFHLFERRTKEAEN
jgi:hypothetical protein